MLKSKSREELLRKKFVDLKRGSAARRQAPVKAAKA